MQSYCLDIQQERGRTEQPCMEPVPSMEGGCVAQGKVVLPFRRSYGDMEGPIVVPTVGLVEGEHAEGSVEALTAAVDAHPMIVMSF
jgi:hypothetical protein